MNKGQSFADAAREWMEYRHRLMELGIVRESTRCNQAAIARDLLQRLGEHPLDHLRKSHIELWMGGRLQSCSPITVRGEMNVLRQILRWCVDEGTLAVPPRMPKLSVPATEDPLPSDEAFLWVLANTRQHIAQALEFMMLTGLSPHELERVQVRDIGGSSSPVLFIGRRPDFAVKQESRRRDIRLNMRAMQLWFETAAGLPATASPFPRVDALQKAISRAVANGKNLAKLVAVPDGIEHVTPKMMRKWFASKVAGEQPEHVLQRLMGHAPGSPITRRHYVRSSDEQTAAAVDAVKL